MTRRPDSPQATGNYPYANTELVNSLRAVGTIGLFLGTIAQINAPWIIIVPYLLVSIVVCP